MYIFSEMRIQYKYSSIAQSVERMTVNHDVAGSSPAGGAKKEESHKVWFFFFYSFIMTRVGNITVTVILSCRLSVAQEVACHPNAASGGCREEGMV